MLQAFIELILEKGYDQVRVQDILDSADVGRSTFYSHFLNKADLLMRNISSGDAHLFPYEGTSELPSVEGLFEHIKENQVLLRALNKSEATHHVNRVFQERLANNWESWLEGRAAAGIPTHYPIPAVARIPSAAKTYQWV